MTTALLLRVDALLDERLRAIGADMSSPYNPVLEFLKMVPLHLIGYEVRGDGTVHVSRILTKSMNLVFRMDGDSILYTMDGMNWTPIEISEILSLQGFGDTMHGSNASALKNALALVMKHPQNIPSKFTEAKSADKKSATKSAGYSPQIPAAKPTKSASPPKKPAAIAGSIKKKK